MEVLIVMGILAILGAVAVPSTASWLRNAQYREAAWGIASALRDARGRAISQNLEHRLHFEVGNLRYCMERGDKSEGSGVWTPVKDWVVLSPGLLMRGNVDCAGTADKNLHFNPNGSGTARYVCVMDDSLTQMYKVGISSNVTGRVVIE